MEKLAQKFEEGIMKELLAALFLLRVGAPIGLLVGFVLTPMPWKLLIPTPFVGGLLLTLVMRTAHRLGLDRPSRAEEAERLRTQARLR